LSSGGNLSCPVLLTGIDCGKGAMKTIGLIGGMSWESTAEYYRLINQAIRGRLGGYHSAKLMLYSVDFDEIEQLQHQDRWHELSRLMVDAAARVAAAGAELVLICSNTMHKAAGEVESKINIPFLHIADATAVKIKQDGVRKAGLIGTSFTMEEDFYRKRMERQGIATIVPDATDRRQVHEIIYRELVHGIIKEESRSAYRRIIARMASEGAEGIILGCTEIPMLVKQADSTIPLYDTTFIHAHAAVEYALGAAAPARD
jgi:aspartate racemase